MGADAARLRRLGPCWLSSIPARPVYAGGLRAFTRGTARAPMMRSMGDNSLIPISDEQAKLGQELVKAVRDSAGYFTGILGDLPKDLIGLLIGDKVKAKRIERWAAIWQRTRERLQDRGADPEPPSLKYAIPILEAAADEENEELQDLWSRLFGRRDGPGPTGRDAPVLYCDGQANRPDRRPRSQSGSR
jgi:hypothetical protein